MKVLTGELDILSIRRDGSIIRPVCRDGACLISVEQGTITEIEFRCSSGKGNPCVVERNGILLSGAWHPSIDGPAFHKLRAAVPEGFTALSEADEIEITKGPRGRVFSFHFSHPRRAVHFIAANYVVKSVVFGDVALYAYVFPGHEERAKVFLDRAGELIERYQEALGGFPFGRFSVVEHSLPGGGCFPTAALLGRDLSPLSSLVTSSLEQAILSQWFGHSVRTDPAGGNWSDGLTTYLADHLRGQSADKSRQFRKQLLMQYAHTVTPENDITLKDYRAAASAASRAVGHAKSAMVFHMLKNQTGEELFRRSLRRLFESKRFQEASWDDVRSAFEEVSGTELGLFFEQWLNKKGYPPLEFTAIETQPRGIGSVVSFDIVQKENRYAIDIPVTVRTDRAVTRRILKVTDDNQRFDIPVEGRPEKLILDDNYDLFRRLSGEEKLTTIGMLFDTDSGLVILPHDDKETAVYSGIGEFFRERGYDSKSLHEVKEKDLRVSSLIVLGDDHSVLKRIFGAVRKVPGDFVVQTRRNPLHLSGVVAVVTASSDHDIRRSLRELMQYGAYSLIAFEKGDVTATESDEGQGGWDLPLPEETIGVEVSRTLRLDEIIDRVSGKKVVYIGEQHDRYEHHRAQLEILRGLYARDEKIAIGMEMFQRPFQGVLDAYIEGNIEEKEFLKSTEYFKRWGFDYNLYKDILRFARDEGIPVVALNIRREVIDKVSKEGLDALTEEERKELPGSMDMTDDAYSRRLKEVFLMHRGGEGRSFENFYQSQIIWDEIMAQSLEEYLSKNPDRRVAVLAGGGHLAFSSGIPRRLQRRTGLDYAVIMPDDSIERDVADFVIFTQPLKAPTSPKLGVLLKEDTRGVSVIGFTEKSAAEKAGLKKEDIITALNGDTVRSTSDIQLFLFYTKPGDTIKAKVLRKRFILGEKELLIDIPL